MKYTRFRGGLVLGLTMLFLTLLRAGYATAASGLFPKSPPGTQVVVFDIHSDSPYAKVTARALQGLVNQGRAEVYLADRSLDRDQLAFANRPIQEKELLAGSDPGMRTLFKTYIGQVKRMFLYDPAKDWTFFLALMAASQGNGVPVTQDQATSLALEFGWKGQVENYKIIGANRVQGYDWALSHLMPGCTRKVVFTVPLAGNVPLFDYVVASKGFVFRLDFKDPNEIVEANKIFSSNGYTLGTSLMGYNGDNANVLANKFGVGLVVSDFYANGSLWSSFPNKTYNQRTGSATIAVPGKVYVSLLWSDGDNIQFDQNGIFTLWHDSMRGIVPVATTLSPALQELNPSLLDWFYSHMSANDELIAGPSGFQFIYGRDYRSDLFSAWVKLSNAWVVDAGFHSVCLWVTTYPSEKYLSYLRNSPLDGIYHNYNHVEGIQFSMGVPVLDERSSSPSDHIVDDVYGALSKITPNPEKPVFVSWSLIVESFNQGREGGYSKIKSIVDRLNQDYPDRYVFMLPRDFFATVRRYFRLRPGIL